MKIRKTLPMIVSGLCLLLLLLWLSGKFTSKVPPLSAGQPQHRMDVKTVPVRLVKMPLTESAAGTVQAVHETSIASKLLSRVTEVNIKAGQTVKKDDVLLRLDDTDLKAKLQQAKSSVAAAEAAQSQAANDEKRMATLLKSNAVSRQDFEKAQTKLKSSEAELARASEAVKEIQSILDYATINSPMDGIVIDKKVNVGDTVVPGQPLLRLFDPERMQMVASVRESIASRLKVGQDIGVKVDTLDKVCSGTVSEIVPESSSSSRTFEVKVTGPCPKGIYTGMFGRIYVPLDEEEVLLIPSASVVRLGQIEIVEAVENGQTVRRAVRTGRVFGNDVEVLSGLREGEHVAVPDGSIPVSEGGEDGR